MTAVLPAVSGPGTLPLRSLGIWSIEEVLRANDGRSRFVVEGLIHATTTLVYGLSEGGKTWAMVDMVAAVAHGGPWLGQPMYGGPRRCLVLPSDSGGEWEDAERLGKGFGDAVLIAEPPPVDPSAWATLADSARSEGVGLVVIDNLYSWAGAVDMNANAEVARPLECLKTLTKADIAVVLVHDTNSGGQKPAGVHSIPAFFRHSLKVTRTTLRSHGNDAAEGHYRLIRDGGRIIHSTSGTKTDESPTANDKPASGVVRSKTAMRHAEALAHLEQAPPGMGVRALGRYLRERMDTVHSEDAGAGLVKTLRAKGLWLPSG